MGQVRSVMTLLLRSIAMAISTCRSGRSTAPHAASGIFLPPEDDKTGLLVHKAGGAEHGRWVFDYNVARDDDDEAGFLFGHHAFVPGEYVSISDASGTMHTFVVKSVTSVNR